MGNVGAETVVEAFASMLQVGFLYPANNPRVTEASLRLAAAVRELAASTGAVQIRAEADALLVGEARFERTRADVTWALDRLARARLHGVTLGPDPDPRALIEFAVALRKSFPPNAPPFDQLWDQDAQGVLPILSATAAAATPGPPRAGAPRSTMQAAAHVDPPPLAAPPQAPRRSPQSRRIDPVLATMARSPRVRETLGRIHARFEEEFSGAEHFDAAGMLEQVVSDLPDAIRGDPPTACAHVEGVLEQVLGQIEGFLLACPDQPAQRLNEVAGKLMQRRLKAADAARSRPPAPPRAGAIEPTARDRAARPASAPAATNSPPPSPGAAARTPPPPPAPAAPSGRRPPPAPSRPASAARATAAPTPSAPRPSRMPIVHPRGAQKPPTAPQHATNADHNSFAGFLAGLESDLLSADSPHSLGEASRKVRDEADSRIAEDLPALIDEIAALPPGDDLDLDLTHPDFEDELLGTALYLLAHGRDSQVVADGIVRHTDHLMADPSPQQRRLLDAYLQLVREGGLADDQAEARERLVAYLQKNGVQHMLSTRDTLDVGEVARTFPEKLVVLIDALDLKDPASQQTFVELCDAVGDEAMADACRNLIEDGTLLTPNRTEKILKFGGRRAAQIAKHLVRMGAAWTRGQVVNYLRRQGLRRSESAALAIVQPVTALPTAYLADLCETVATGEASAKLHGYTSLLLRQYVRDTAERPGDLDRRLYAIRALGFWATPETVQYLEQLAKEGRFLQQSKDARAVRQAATEALEQLQSGAEGAA